MNVHSFGRAQARRDGSGTGPINPEINSRKKSRHLVSISFLFFVFFFLFFSGTSRQKKKPSPTTSRRWQLAPKMRHGASKPSESWPRGSPKATGAIDGPWRSLHISSCHSRRSQLGARPTPERRRLSIEEAPPLTSIDRVDDADVALPTECRAGLGTVRFRRTDSFSIHRSALEKKNDSIGF